MKAACLPLPVLPGTKLLHSESSLAFMQKVGHFPGDLLLSFLWPGLGSSRVGALQKRVHRGRGRAEADGGGEHRANQGPLERSRNSSNPSRWNARRRLLHSRPNVFVITPDLPPAPPSPPRYGAPLRAHCGAGARSPRASRVPQTAGELPRPSPKSAPPSAGLAAATVALSLAPARGPRCAVQ